MLFHGCTLAKPGALLELNGMGKHFNGDIMASQVKHRLINGNWTSEVDFGMPVFTQNHSSEAAMDAAANGTAGIRGLHVGIVLKLDADPEGQHRIEVSVPIMNAPTVGVWARLAHFYASSGFGAFVIPETRDQVVLGFFNDAPSCPVILGSLYSRKHNPPVDMRQTNPIKALVTRSKMKVEFDDDKKVVTIVTPANNTIVISDDSKSIYLHDQNNNKVELGPDGIVLDSAKDVTIKATGSVHISAMNSVGVVAAMNANTTGLNITYTAHTACRRPDLRAIRSHRSDRWLRFSASTNQARTVTGDAATKSQCRWKTKATKKMNTQSTSALQANILLEGAWALRF